MLLCPNCSRFLSKFPAEAERKLASALLHSTSSAQILSVTSSGKLYRKTETYKHRVPLIFSPRITSLRSNGSWSDETHYSVLGVKTDCSQAAIRSAYLKLTKEFHPDHNVGKSRQETENIHNKFVRINEAYSVLSNPRERRTYDLSVLMRQDRRWRDQNGIRTNAPEGRTHVFNPRPMDFAERAKMAGFREQDPDFYKKHGNYPNKVIRYIIVFVTVGLCLQAIAIKWLYERHSAELMRQHLKNVSFLEEAQRDARKYGPFGNMERITGKKLNMDDFTPREQQIIYKAQGKHTELVAEEEVVSEA
eukprot:TRINITY_DN6733_c0_g1_i1.p1 TRINITY_DN6733_c0_g1~~TRINITY_DN6733_c0_g1_i1.p1  ORF type:complete len:318 (-),score=28.64 TRINITY_DN6733_c0_g1_i1:219-1133(-)